MMVLDTFLCMLTINIRKLISTFCIRDVLKLSLLSRTRISHGACAHCTYISRMDGHQQHITAWTLDRCCAGRRRWVGRTVTAVKNE